MESAINLRAVMNKILNILSEHLLLPLLLTHAKIYTKAAYIMSRRQKMQKDNCWSWISSILVSITKEYILNWTLLSMNNNICFIVWDSFVFLIDKDVAAKNSKFTS